MKNKIIWFIIFVILVIAIILASKFVNKQGEETIQESKENTNILNEGEENMNIIKVSDENFEQEVLTDSKWLEFILSQIFQNSMKYRSEESKIKVSFLYQNNEIQLKIWDNGIGISKSDLPRVFDKSFTGQNGRKVSTSTGMGLYIARKLCQKLGHKIEIASEENHFTEVTITFYRNEFYDVAR